MDTILDKPASAEDLQRFLRQVGRPARWNSSGLAGAEDTIGRYIKQQPDITLGEMRGALLGTGFTWSPEGKLAYVPTHVALIEELEALIEIHGWDARAAELFL